MPLGHRRLDLLRGRAAEGHSTYTHELTESELHINSPYNTRTHTGLPPTPISNPGVASIEAAAHPAHAAYLYYVAGADGCGEQVFSDTQAAFEANAAAYEAAVKRKRRPPAGLQAQLMRRLGVLGWPVAHSRSPAMHNAALRSLGMSDWHYQRLPVPPELFDETVRALGRAGFVGANVTIPHKHAALAAGRPGQRGGPGDRRRQHAHLRRRTARSPPRTPTPRPDRRARSLARRDFERARARRRRQRAGRGVGAARRGRRARCRCGTAPPSARRSWPASIGRARRRALRAGRSARQLHLGGPSARVERSATEGRALNQLGLTGDQVGEYSHVIDLVYRSTPTPLLAAARRAGARTVDGLEILVAQGALSLEHWTGRAAPLEVMRQAAREESAERP